MRLARELSRRKLRTTLTIIGITIGIWALVVFSSMANKINGLVGLGSDVLRRQDRRDRRRGVRHVADAARRRGDHRRPRRRGGRPAEGRAPLGRRSGRRLRRPGPRDRARPGCGRGPRDLQAGARVRTDAHAEDTGNVVVLGSTLARKHGVVAGGLGRHPRRDVRGPRHPAADPHLARLHCPGAARDGTGAVPR